MSTDDAIALAGNSPAFSAHRLQTWFKRALLILIAGFLFVYPVAMIVVGIFRSARPGRPGTWTLEALTTVLSSSGTYAALGNSLVFAGVSTIFATLLGLILAFLVTRTDSPLRWAVTPAMIMIFAAPHMLYAVAWALLADPVGGVLNGLAIAAGADGPIFNAYSWAGLLVVQSLKISSFCYLLLLPAFANMNRSYEEASLVSGASRWQTFFRIDLPLLVPAISGVVIISMVFGLGAFDVPQILGGLPGISVLSTEIYKKLNYSFPPDYAGASALCVFLILALGLMLAMQWRALRGRSYVTVTGKAYRNEPWRIGKWRWAGVTAILAFLVVGLLLPVSQLVLTAFQTSIGVYDFTTANFSRVLSDPQIADAFRITGIIAIFGGLAAMFIAAVLSFAARRGPWWLAGFLDGSMMIPIVMPGVVLAVGLLWAYISLPGLRLLYGSFWFAFMGLVILVMPVASRAIQGALAQISNDLEEAASVSGASRARVFVDVFLPLMRGGFLAGWLVTAVIVAGTLDIPLMLLPPTSPNVAVLAYSYMNSALMSQTSAVLVLLMAAIALTTLVFVLAGLLLRNRRKPHS